MFKKMVDTRKLTTKFCILRRNFRDIKSTLKQASLGSCTVYTWVWFFFQSWISELDWFGPGFWCL